MKNKYEDEEMFLKYGYKKEEIKGKEKIITMQSDFIRKDIDHDQPLFMILEKYRFPVLN